MKGVTKGVNVANPDNIIPLIYQKWTAEFKEIDFAVSLNGPFDLTTPVQALQQEAGAKGMGVIIQASIVPLDWIYGLPPEESEKKSDDQPAQPE